MKVITIPNGPLQANCYVVECFDKALIIDPGYAEKELLDYLKANAQKVELILLTHRHFDHVNFAGKVKEMNDAKIAISTLDECGLFSDEDSLTGNFGFVYGKADVNLRADVLLNDGDTVALGDISFKVMATPGHSVGSVCFLGDGVLFSGDTLFKGSIGRTDLPTADVSQMIKSLKKLIKLPDDTVVYPGHGAVTTIGEEKTNNPFIIGL